jgi:hypothetical protein
MTYHAKTVVSHQDLYAIYTDYSDRRRRFSSQEAEMTTLQTRHYEQFQT